MISSSFGTLNGIHQTCPRFPAILDIFSRFGLLFHSMIDGKVQPKMPTRPAQLKTNFFSAALTQSGLHRRRFLRLINCADHYGPAAAGIFGRSFEFTTCWLTLVSFLPVGLRRALDPR